MAASVGATSPAAVYGDKVYLATLDARVIALRRSNGSVVWNVSAAKPNEGYSFTMAPLAADGKIIVGASGGEFQIRGFVDAFDPETGRRLWRFWTTPSPEQGGWYGKWSDTTPEGDRLPRDIAKEKRDSARYAEAWRRTGDRLAHAHFTKLPEKEQFGVLSAVDVSTGTIRWQRRVHGHLMYGGALATARGLVFLSENSGWLDALDAATWETLWRQRAVEGPAGPPISFLVQGHQRIAVTSKRGMTVYGLGERGPAVAATRAASDALSATVANTGGGGVRSSSR